MRARRYVGWIQRQAKAIWIVSALAVVAATYLAVVHLPLESDFSHLLPDDAPSVRDAERLAQRMPAQDTMLMLIVAPERTSREAAAHQAIEGIAVLRARDPDLVSRIEVDDVETRAFVRAHRHLFLPIGELETARAALAKRIADAKLRANPMFIELGDPDGKPDDLDALRARLRSAEDRLDKPAYVSADGRTQVIVIRTAFRGTDVERDHRIMAGLDRLAMQIRAVRPMVQVGFAGGPAVTVAEHGALTRGMLLSSLITLVLVALVLMIHLRSLRILVLVTANILAATIVAFGCAALTVGHLNAATAFLGAIIAGNGINYGILLVARYLEERRTLPAQAAMATAIAGTLRPTLVASLGAAIAYGALAATQFRGFADFALIGSVGMLVCWIGSFTLLPVLILRFAATPRSEVSSLFGRFVVRVFGFRRPAVVCAVAGLLSIGAVIVTCRYVANDPFEYDMTKLRSHAPDAIESRRWLRVSDETFGHGLAGLAGQTFIALDRADQVPAVVEALHALTARDPIVGPVGSILDVVPSDQPRKIALLAELRTQLDEAAGVLEEPERSDLLAFRPPDGLAPITAHDLPAEVAVKLTERDGRIGYIVAVRPGERFDERDGRDLIRFAEAVRQVRIANGETVSTAGASVMFADVLTQIQTDGPTVTAIAAFGLVVMVVLVVGRSRRSYAVLAASAGGSLAMIAVCAIAGLRINFLDFVALPITLGLGIDYAINVADRAAIDDPLVALRSTGGTVLVCSLTTAIGYASLLVSDNLAIRGFGLASLIGEITCVVAALVIVPAIIAMPRLAVRAGYDDAASSHAR
ncbi:MAG: putative rane protein [Deltaproteobacteria bacterium]|nr:putative rane protein [Deltaproteobacteria bacterium]